MKRRLCLVALLLAVGCKSVPAMHYYMLEPGTEPARSSRVS